MQYDIKEAVTIESADYVGATIGRAGTIVRPLKSAGVRFNCIQSCIGTSFFASLKGWLYDVKLESNGKIIKRVREDDLAPQAASDSERRS